MSPSALPARDWNGKSVAPPPNVACAVSKSRMAVMQSVGVSVSCACDELVDVYAHVLLAMLRASGVRPVSRVDTPPAYVVAPLTGNPSPEIDVMYGRIVSVESWTWTPFSRTAPGSNAMNVREMLPALELRSLAKSSPCVGSMVGGGTEKVLLALAYWHVYRWRTTSPVHGKSTPGSNEARNTSAFVVCVP